MDYGGRAAAAGQGLPSGGAGLSAAPGVGKAHLCAGGAAGHGGTAGLGGGCGAVLAGGGAPAGAGAGADHLLVGVHRCAHRGAGGRMARGMRGNLIPLAIAGFLEYYTVAANIAALPDERNEPP